MVKVPRARSARVEEAPRAENSSRCHVIPIPPGCCNAAIREECLVDDRTRGLPTGGPSLLSFGQNRGTYCPQRCLDLLRRYDDRSQLRFYSSPGNTTLRRALARENGVESANVYLSWGSGPALKQAIFHVLDREIRSSPLRILRYLLFRRGYPICTPTFTYFNVALSAKKAGLELHYLPLSAETGFVLDPGRVAEALDRQDGLVYLVNPNSPTGQVLISIESLAPLLERYPKSTFLVDEAYVDYLYPEEHARMAGHVLQFPNLLVTRTFSFAYGLASLKVGYLVANETLVAELERAVTNYRIGRLQESLVLAALSDREHLDEVREKTRAEVARIQESLAPYPNLETFESKTNFFLGRFTDGTPATLLDEALKKKRILIKALTEIPNQAADVYFRVTIGLPEENDILIKALGQILEKGL